MNFLVRSFEELLKTFLPEICSICNENIYQDSIPSKLCSRCISELPLRNTENCFKYMEAPDIHEYSVRNLLAEQNVLELPLFISAYYDLNIRQIVNYLKFYGRKEMAISIAEIMAIFYEREKRSVYSHRTEILDADYCLAIPIHEKRLKERGYNQMALVTENFSRLTEIQDLEGSLIREKYTLRQSETRDKTHRLENVKEAFTWVGTENIKNKKILLMDDVVASGQTLWQAARELMNYGGKPVLFAFASNQKI